MWTDEIDRDFHRRASVTARWATKSGAATWNDVRLERFEIPLNAAREPHGNSIFLARRETESTGTLTRSPVGGNAGFVDRRRIDADLGALAKQIFDQPVEGLVGAVPDIIIIAREKGDAKFARVAPCAAAG